MMAPKEAGVSLLTLNERRQTQPAQSFLEDPPKQSLSRSSSISSLSSTISSLSSLPASPQPQQSPQPQPTSPPLRRSSSLSPSSATSDIIKLDKLAMTEISFKSCSMDRQEWLQACTRQLRGLLKNCIRTRKKNGQLAIRFTRRAVEILEVDYRTSNNHVSPNCEGNARKTMLFRHNVGNIVCRGELVSLETKELVYIRKIKPRVFELVAFLITKDADREIVIEIFKSLFLSKRRSYGRGGIGNKENEANIPLIELGDSDSDQEIDVIEVLPPIPLREHPIVDIADEDGI